MAGICKPATDWESGTVDQTGGGDDNYVLKYNIFDIDTFDDAITLLGATAPTFYRGVNRMFLKAEPVSNHDWRGEAIYQYGDNGEADMPDFAWETTGGTYKRMFAREHISDHPANGLNINLRNHHGAIGVTNQGTVEGVDVPVPEYNWSETYTKAQSFVSTPYKLAVFNLTGRMNLYPFKGFAKGEVLFIGACASQRGQNPMRIQYKFKSLPNEANIVVSPTITVTFKYGWDYLWCEYMEVNDGANSPVSTRPICAHIDRVFLFGDMSVLGIGV